MLRFIAEKLCIRRPSVFRSHIASVIFLVTVTRTDTKFYIKFPVHIIILLEPYLHQERNLPKSLLQDLKKRLYIAWPGDNAREGEKDLFWKQLRKALTDTGEGSIEYSALVWHSDKGDDYKFAMNKMVPILEDPEEEDIGPLALRIVCRDLGAHDKNTLFKLLPKFVGIGQYFSLARYLNRILTTCCGMCTTMPLLNYVA